MSNIVKKRLGDIINFKRGYDLPSYNRIEGEYPIISSSGISGYHSEYKKEGEGLITGRYGTLGEVYYINGRYWPHNTALYVTDFKNNYPKYAYFLMKCLGNLKTSDKSTVPGINRNDLHELVVPFIRREFQKPLADFLFNIEEKIELNNRINAELEAMAKTLYDYWFVQFDFPNEQGNPYKTSDGKMVWNEQLKREIPEGWKVKELGTEIEIQRGISYTSKEINGEGIPMINLNSFNLDGTYKPSGVKTFSGKFLEKNIAKPGDLLIAATDVTRNADIIGKAILVPHYYDEDLVFSMDIAKIIPNDIPCSFLMLLFNSHHYHNYIKWYANGTLVLHLNLDGVKRYVTEIPPKYLLEKYNTLFQPIANRIYMTAIENQHLSSLRDWLLPMLMNGQVTVGEAEKAVYQAEDELRVAAEPAVGLRRDVDKPSKQEAFLRKLMLASHIVYELCDEPTFGHTKLMKLLYLSEQVGNMALQTNYKKFAAGPFDGKMLTLIDQEYEKNKWFTLEKRSYTVNGQQREATIYKKTEKSLCYKKHFDNYFGQESDSINKLISLFRNEKTQLAEIVATLYFAWNELIAKKTIISESILIKAFYDFHKEKKKFTKEQILDGYQFMLRHGVHP